MKSAIIAVIAVAFAGCASRTTEEKILALDSRIIALENAVSSLEGKASAKDGNYTVRAGDTAWNISRMFGLQMKELLDLNPEVDFRKMKVGQIIVISKEPNQ